MSALKKLKAEAKRSEKLIEAFKTAANEEVRL